MLRISGAGFSHVGLIRENNEDACFVGPTCALVADGVGGGAAGEVASATAAYVVSAMSLMRPGMNPIALLDEAVHIAQVQVARGVELDPSRAGMATTLTALVTDGQSFALAHLGDSRGYLFREGMLARITHDHTYVQDLIDQGRLDPDQAATHPWRNVVMRSVNGHPDDVADVTPIDLQAGDRVLLASDGVTDMVPERLIADILQRRADDAAVESLVAAALGQGGRDNITCVVATIVDGPPVVADGRLLGSVAEPANVVDLAAVRAMPPLRSATSA